MSKVSGLVITILVGVFILVFVGYFLSRGTRDNQVTIDTGGLSVNKTSGELKETTPSTNERYIIYTPEGLSFNKDKRRVLFFYANWCPTCRPADLTFKNNIGKIPADVTLIRVNYNDPDTDENEKQLAAKYAVTYQHTFVQIDKEDKEVAKWNGGQLSELLSNIK